MTAPRVTVALMRRALAGAALGAALASGGPAVAVQNWNGNELTEDFEELPLGLGTIELPDDWELYSVLTGGEVAAGSAMLPAASGEQVYVGSNVVFDVPNRRDFGWVGIAANLSATAPLVVQSYIYDPDAEDFITPGAVFDFGPGTNFRFDTGANAIYLRLEFSSAAPFSIDDLQLGTPDGPIVIAEPGTWAMLIGGFGLVGAVLRRRRTGGTADLGEAMAGQGVP